MASSGRQQPLQDVGATKSVLQVEREEVLEGKNDSLMRRLEKMEVEKREAQAIDLKAAEARSTCEECGEYGHVQKELPGGSQDARLHEEGRMDSANQLPLRAR